MRNEVRGEGKTSLYTLLMNTVDASQAMEANKGYRQERDWARFQV